LKPNGILRAVLIVVLFLISGFTLPPEAISSGLNNYRFHFYIRSYIVIVTFVVQAGRRSAERLRPTFIKCRKIFLTSSRSVGTAITFMGERQRGHSKASLSGIGLCLFPKQSASSDVRSPENPEVPTVDRISYAEHHRKFPAMFRPLYRAMYNAHVSRSASAQHRFCIRIPFTVRPGRGGRPDCGSLSNRATALPRLYVFGLDSAPAGAALELIGYTFEPHVRWRCHRF
jgi:hypothetical protein